MRINTDKSTVAQYSDEVESFARITSLPVIAQGELTLELEGQTVTNLLDDDVAGAESTAGWTTVVATIETDSNNQLEGANCLKCTINGNSGALKYNILSLLDTGKYYLISAHVKNNNLTTGIKFYTENDKVGNVGIDNSYNTTTSYVRQGLVLQPTDFDSATFQRLVVLGVGSSSQFGFVDAIQLNEISATEYALGADALLGQYGWHLGTKSVDKTRVVITGKQLFDKSKHTLSTATYTVRYYVKPSTQYAVSNSTNFEQYDAGDNLITTTLANLTITTASNVSYIVPRNDNVFSVKDTYMLVEGAVVPTTYAPYTETSVVSQLPLHSVPAISDKYKANEGEHTQNVSGEYVLVEDDVTGLVTSLSNVDYAVIPNKSNQKVGSIGINGTVLYLGRFEFNNGSTISSVDTVDAIGSFYTTATSIIVLFAKGTYANLAAVKTGLAGDKIYYQLAKPIITYFPSKVLNAEASGSIRQETFISEDTTVQFYNAGLTLDASYSLSSLDDIVEINKFDLNNGSYTTVPRTLLTLASSTSITISGSLNGELYSLSYTYRNLSLNANKKYSYGVNHIAETKSHGKQLKLLDSNITDINVLIAYINGVIDDMFQEQADVPVTLNATTTEADILHFSSSNTRYILRELTLKAVDPGANTITVRLYGLVNNVLTVIDTFEITTANFGTYFNLIDMFGLTDFAGDEIRMTVETDAGSYAVTGQYSHALTRG